MSYVKRYIRAKNARLGKHRGVALGDLSSTLSQIFSGASSAAGTAVNIVNDPYLPEVACLVNQLHAINAGQNPGECSKTAPDLPGGVGLRDAVTPLRMYVFAKENPWVFPIAAFAVLGIPFLIGLSFGRGQS